MNSGAEASRARRAEDDNTSRPFFSRQEVEQQFADGTWQNVLFAELAAVLHSVDRPFPCLFAVRGFEDDQLRYVFLDEPSLPALASSLACYVACARQFGPNTSLVVFTRPGPVCPLDHYKGRFWSVLNGLAQIDGAPWPENIPVSIDEPTWEFCFAGEPIFVVCNTPAHTARQSRRSTSFMMTFQPRWVFDKILSTPRAADAVFAKISARLKRYDFIPPSPHLGHYGHPNNREYLQYVLDDKNEALKCPFTQLARKERSMIRILPDHMPLELPSALLNTLPNQGCIELQHDAPGKEHSWHTHQNDETLIILAGALHFYWEDGARVCTSGDVIEMPAGTRHGSIALEDGAIYAIAFQKLEL
jgi:uncharacterized protein